MKIDWSRIGERR